ncbi:hypothetical protein I7I48_09590 [Histoplasma ohiense]|nr:hypothetical protein I7I48_09590 [Histoplasma ohiense (nom. inval.)]
MYLLDTNCFQNAISKFSSQMRMHGRYSYDYSILLVDNTCIKSRECPESYTHHNIREQHKIFGKS